MSPSPSGNIATQKGGSVLPETPVGKAAQTVVIKVATQSLQSVVQVYTANKTNEINVLSGSLQLAQRQQVTNQIVSSVTNLGTSALSGASMGAVFGGGPGAVAGTVVGLIGSVASGIITKFTDYNVKKDALQTDYIAEQQQVEYIRDRAGVFYNQSR